MQKNGKMIIVFVYILCLVSIYIYIYNQLPTTPRQFQRFASCASKTTPLYTTLCLRKTYIYGYTLVATWSRDIISNLMYEFWVTTGKSMALSPTCTWRWSMVPKHQQTLQRLCCLPESVGARLGHAGDMTHHSLLWHSRNIEIFQLSPADINSAVKHLWLAPFRCQPDALVPWKEKSCCKRNSLGIRWGFASTPTA